MELQRRFTPLTMLLISINGMVGSAWLFGPLYAAKIAGSAAIISWIIGGVITVFIALTFAELSTLLPIAGGMARFAQLSHGTFASMVLSWAGWISCVTIPPIEVQATLQYAANYFPSLIKQVHGVHVLTGIGYIFATALMLLLSMINVTSFKGLVRFNFVLFAFKVLVIVITIIALLKTSFYPQNFANIMPGYSVQAWEAIFSAIAGGGIAFAFTGFTHGIALAGETQRPHVAIPLAVIGCVVCCLLLYLGLQIAFIAVLDPAYINQGWQTMSFVGEVGPFAGIATLLGLLWLAKLLYADAVVSPLGAGLIYVTSTARTIYAMSKNGYVPVFLSRVTKKGFPVWAVALNFILGMFLFLPLPGWQAMVSFLVSAVVISYAIGPISLLCLRLQLPDVQRSFKLPAAKLLCFIAFFCCNLISYWTGWETMWKLGIAIGVGLIFLVATYLRGLIDKVQFGMKSAFWVIPYLAGLMAISYLGSFGGKGYITFGWDFLVIGCFSGVILTLAIATRQINVAEGYADYQCELTGAEERT